MTIDKIFWAAVGQVEKEKFILWDWESPFVGELKRDVKHRLERYIKDSSEKDLIHRKAQIRKVRITIV